MNESMAAETDKFPPLFCHYAQYFEGKEIKKLLVVFGSL
jgi:hypothetical protein